MLIVKNLNENLIFVFSKKIGVSDGLGLQECMATINDGLDDELQVSSL